MLVKRNNGYKCIDCSPGCGACYFDELYENGLEICEECESEKYQFDDSEISCIPTE